jgi:elongation factor 1-beta
MARLVARIRILPADAEVSLDNILSSIKNNLGDNMDIKAHTKEPIAFGLNALICDFLLDDEEGQMDKLEDDIKKSDGVGEIQTINISRQSVNMK